MVDTVDFSTRGEAAIIKIANPPVNALNHKVRAGIMAALKRAEEDGSVSCVVLCGSGRTFPAGVDLRELDAGAGSPPLSEVCLAIETASKPVVACLHGTALGGGYELAMAAHARLALPGTRVGLPEIGLGLLPDAGATQRLPRLVAVEDALQLLLSGSPVDVERHREKGFVDGIVDGDLLDAGVAHAIALTDTGPQRTSARRDRFQDAFAYQDAIDAARASLSDRKPSAVSHAIIDCVEAAMLLPFHAGLSLEAEVSAQHRDSDACRALRHVFTATQQATVPRPGLPRPSPVSRVALFGSGPSLAGLAVICLDAGREVAIMAKDENVANMARARVGAIYAGAISRGRLSEQRRAERLSRLNVVSEGDATDQADFLLYTDAEDSPPTEQTLLMMAETAGPDGLFAFNLPHVDFGELDRQIGAAGRIVAMRFSAPAHVKRLVEIGAGKTTDDATESTAMGFATALGKQPVRSAADRGLIGGRLRDACLIAADSLLADGASPYDVDASFKSLGFKVGPFETLDSTGIVREVARLGSETLPVCAYLLTTGRAGRFQGIGIYVYDDEGRASQDPELAGQIEALRAASERSPVAQGSGDLTGRCLIAMMNEGAKLLDQDVVRRAGDIDVVMALGHGFPRDLGGPMKAAEHRGLLGDLRQLERLSDRGDFWTPARSLREAVKNGGSFDALS